MLSRFKTFYNSRTSREKLLLIAIIWAPLLWWASSLNRSQREVSENYKLAQAREESANQTISVQAAVEAKLRRSMGDFNVEMLVSDPRLELEKILREMQLTTYAMSAPDPKPSGRMKIHSVVVTIKSSSLEILSDFEARLIKRAPYISMSNAEFNTDGRGVISARYEINSFEFNDKQ